jgi:hypothetical protein
VIVLSRTTTFPKIGMATMVQPSTDISVPVEQLNDHHERTVAAIKDDHITRQQRVQQLSGQCRFASLFSFVWPRHNVDDDCRGE